MLSSDPAFCQASGVLFFFFFCRGAPPTQASVGRGFVFLWKHLAITVGVSPSAVTALTQGLDRVSLLEVAVLQRSHILKRVPDHELELIQALLLEQNAAKVAVTRTKQGELCYKVEVGVVALLKGTSVGKWGKYRVVETTNSYSEPISNLNTFLQSNISRQSV